MRRAVEEKLASFKLREASRDSRRLASLQRFAPSTDKAIDLRDMAKDARKEATAAHRVFIPTGRLPVRKGR